MSSDATGTAAPSPAMVPQLGSRQVIDYHVLKNTPNQLFVAPALARQTSYAYGANFITVADAAIQDSVRRVPREVPALQSRGVETRRTRNSRFAI